MMFIFTFLYSIEQVLAVMVMPLSFSWSLLSSKRSVAISSWLSLKAWVCFKRASIRVVLPWSTWAMTAMFLICLGIF